ncbi:MAG: hypothetical protein KKF56_04065 [Nanoarchaeota archaeon]|nr:hypothetical protein [Nanoarchaeota archaeon]
MIFKQELIKKIKDYFGLNIYETKVWLALISKGIASAGEIAEISGVPRSRTYDVLESLEKRGFAISKIGKPVKYISVKPESVVEKLKTNVMKEASEKVKMLANLKEYPEYVELQELHNSKFDPIKQSTLSASVKGKQNIIDQIKEVVDTAKQEAIIATSTSDFLEKSRIFKNMIDKLTKSKVKTKVYLNGEDSEIKRINDKFGLRAIKTEQKAKFFIADKREILFLITNSSQDDQDIGIWLNSPFFVQSFSEMYDKFVR